MEKEEIKKLVKTCVETLAEAKGIDLSVFDIIDDEANGAVVFEIRFDGSRSLETALCVKPGALGGDVDKVELGKAIMLEIWGNAKAMKRLKAKLFEDALAQAEEELRKRRGSASAAKLTGYDPNGDRLREALDRWKDGLPVSGPLKK